MIESFGSLLISGMRVAGRAAAPGDRLAMDRRDGEASVPSKGPRRPGAAENFKNAVRDRIERYQKSGRTDNTSPEAAQALADSVAQAALEVRNVYGQDAANTFMAEVLKKIDKKGFSQESLTDAVSSAVQYLGQASGPIQLNELTEAFNRDLGMAEDDPGGREIKGFSQAVADFFGLEADGKNGPAVQGLNEKGQWGEVAARDLEERELFIAGTQEAAQLALAGSASFSLAAVGSETVSDLANFLRDELGAEEAAVFLEEQPGDADFMTTMDTVIDKALQASRNPGDAAKLESYLNDQVKNAVNASSSVNHNPFGNVEFEGWTFDQTAQGSDGASDAACSSKWRYTNRDDVTFTRTGRTSISEMLAKAAAKEDGRSGAAEVLAEVPEEEEYSLADLVKKIAKGPERIGELVDTEA